MLRSLLTTLGALALAAGAAHAAPREVKLGHHVETNTPLHQQAVLFKEEIERRLPGEFEIVIYPGGQLGKEAAQIDAVRLGVQDMSVIASGAMKLDTKVGVFDLPWLFESREHVRRALEGPLGEAVETRLEESAGFEVLGTYENGFRHVINKVRPIAQPSDLEGLKIRITGGKLRQDVFAKMGGNPAPVAWTEVFSAMQTGVVDGAEAAIYGFNSAKLYEVADKLSLTKHVYSPSFLIASNTFMDSLTDEQRTAFQEAAEAITDPAYEQATELENSALEAMKGEGVEVNEVDFEAFQEVTRPVYQDYIDAEGGEFIDLIDAAGQSS
ncbi:TRAP transporter substrate-binding protein [Acuticoccus sp.]|uniref:TRAP transporter substrate-binding protein n=1 Tax=Acuticoccus sp. TaxID=1904378 RepID=UPI003B51EF9D